ncbi:C2H2-type zinc finger protein [Candidatus Pacearchaeota archaeon]|nr:C2H2-type zinc finger protein [Candidatus Pacearchaeota archaeon]
MNEENKFKCGKCEREFSSKEALDMHMNSKHYEAPSGIKKLSNVNKKKMRNWAVFIVIILVIVGVAYFLAFKPVTPGKYDDFAQCLTDNNVTMYGAWWCNHCQDQKDLFGDSWQYVNYIECSTPDGNAQLPVCTNAGIGGYPTWELSNGSRIDRVLTLKYLSQITNCTLP